MTPASVVSIVTSDALDAILPRLHAGGYGANARVLRPTRLPVREQLQRTGVRVAQMPERVGDAESVLVVLAAGRSPAVADLARQHGATATWIVGLTGEWEHVEDGEVTVRPVETDRSTLPTPSLIPTHDHDGSSPT